MLTFRSEWPRVLRCGSAAARLLGLWVRIRFYFEFCPPVFFCTNLMGLTNFVPGIKIKVKVSLQQAMKAQRVE